MKGERGREPEGERERGRGRGRGGEGEEMMGRETMSCIYTPKNRE